MPPDPISTTEQDRLAALQSYHILDTATEEDFEELTELAAAVCGTPISLISLVDDKRQWFKSHRGLGISETDRAYSFCAHAINQPTELMQVEDAQQDERFRNNPLVTGAPHITFYAGMPLVDSSGYALGSLCVIDREKRTLTPQQEKALKTLAHQVVTKLELRKKIQELQAAQLQNETLDRKTRQTESNLQNVIEQSPAAIIVFRGPELLIDAANATMLQLLDQQPGIVGQPLLQAIPELKDQPAYQQLHEVYRTGQAVFGSETAVQLKRNGRIETGYFSFTYTPLIEEGKVAGIIDMAVEVTESVKARQLLEKQGQQLQQANQQFGAVNKNLISTIEKLQKSNIDLHTAQTALKQANIDFVQSENRLQSVINTMAEGMGIVNLKGDIVFVNPMAERILGLKRDEVTQRTYGDARWQNLRLDGTPLPENEHPMAIMMAAQKPVYDMEIGIQPPDADRFYISINAAPLYDAEGRLTGGVATFMDVTERRHILNQLMESEERLRLTVDAARLGTFSMNLTTQQVTLNQQCRRMFGFQSEGPVTAEAIYQTILPHYLLPVQQAMKSAVAGNLVCDVRYEIKRADTGQTLWMHSVGSVTKDAGGTPAHFYGVVQDITEQKQEEQRKQDFIGIVSHELKTPLTSLKSYVQILQLKARQENDIFRINTLGKVSRQVDRMNAMITGFLDVARLGESKIHLNQKEFNMADVVKQAEEESLATIITHKVVFAPVEYTPVDADAEKIEQVLVNFINNAVKYSPRGSTINVACITKDAVAYVSVRDEGMGIAPKDLPHLFDRFYRVDNAAMTRIKGFGIGLYICKEIIKRHGGEIGVNSEVGRGSTFWFKLPVQVADFAS